MYRYVSHKCVNKDKNCTYLSVVYVWLVLRFIEYRYKYNYSDYNLTTNTFIFTVLFVNYVNEYIREQVLGPYMGLNVRIEA